MIKDVVVPKTKEVKFIFFSGKGGVGKSTMSCATAVWLAKKGYKTLLVTTDPAPNLSDIFSQKIGHHITPIHGIENLHAIEIDPDEASEEYRERIIAPLREHPGRKKHSGHQGAAEQSLRGRGGGFRQVHRVHG